MTYQVTQKDIDKLHASFMKGCASMPQRQQWALQALIDGGFSLEARTIQDLLAYRKLSIAEVINHQRQIIKVLQAYE